MPHFAATSSRVKTFIFLFKIRTHFSDRNVATLPVYVWQLDSTYRTGHRVRMYQCEGTWGTKMHLQTKTGRRNKTKQKSDEGLCVSVSAGKHTLI